MSSSENSIESTHASPATERQITLHIGERRFVTAAHMITQESGFFAALLSGHWDNRQADGLYFIDADAELFEHILRYLRRGVLPVFYDSVKGHDHTLYLALLEEAKYFQVPRLVNWLRGKGYLQAIKIRYSADELDGIQYAGEQLCFATKHSVNLDKREDILEGGLSSAQLMLSFSKERVKLYPLAA